MVKLRHVFIGNGLSYNKLVHLMYHGVTTWGPEVHYLKTEVTCFPLQLGYQPALSLHWRQECQFIDLFPLTTGLPTSPFIALETGMPVHRLVATMSILMSS